MKEVLAILTGVLIPFSIQAQTYYPLVESNKIWTTAHTYGHPGFINSDAIRFEGDTLINGSLYKIIWKSTDNFQTTWERYGFILEMNKQVFWLTWSGGAPNNMIYDFGAEAGDTVSLFADPMGFYFVVDSVGETTLLTGESRRTQYLSGYSVGNSLFGHDTWVEGVGSMYGVLQSGTGVLIGDNPQLICFTQNDTVKYHNPSFTQCYVVTGFKSPSNDKGVVEIVQNPGGGNLQVEVKDPAILPVMVSFYDVTGRMITECKLTDRLTIINLDRLSGSSFLICLMNGADGIIFAGKMFYSK